MPPEPPIFPYYAAHVVSGSVVSTFGMPFAVEEVEYGKYPSLVLGENGTVFATDSTNEDYGPMIVSFNLNSGLINWSFQASPSSALDIIAATSNNGLAVNDSQVGILHFDSVGNFSQITDTFGGIAKYAWNENWYIQNILGISNVALPLSINPDAVWGTPNGSPSQNCSAGALYPYLSQPIELEIDLDMSDVQAKSPKSEGIFESDNPAPPANCPICSMLPEEDLIIDGNGPTFLILIGDPGLNEHNVGYSFALSAQQKANELNAQGKKIIACRVSRIQHVVAALTEHGYIDGGVIYFGHSGHFGPRDGSWRTSLLAVGQDAGEDTNIHYSNVAQLAVVKTANNGGNILGPNASFWINGCSAGSPIDSSLALGGVTYPIAQLISNQINRAVYAYDVGMYFSALNADNDPYVDGQGRYAPTTLPSYMVPAGAPGHKPRPRPFTPRPIILP